MGFAERLRELRTEQDMQQNQLAELVNLRPSAISKYETGATQPNIEMLCRLADVFGVSLDYLVGKSTVPNPYTADKVSPAEFDLLLRFRGLSAENKIRIDERIHAMREHAR